MPSPAVVTYHPGDAVEVVRLDGPWTASLWELATYLAPVHGFVGWHRVQLKKRAPKTREPVQIIVPARRIRKPRQKTKQPK